VSINRVTKALGLVKSTVYYKPKS